MLASTLARYFRSNKGLKGILADIDWTHPDQSVDQIFNFVDYGHASIGGLTGGIAIALDNVSMFLAYQLFALSPFSDGKNPVPATSGWTFPDYLTQQLSEFLTT